MNDNAALPRRTYFPNLDGLRFIGSLIIIIVHIEDIKFRDHRSTISLIREYTPGAYFDVTLFFVLSGFLITYLLLKEKQERNEINIKHYYTRRIIRIWPLYFLILILGYFVLPHLSYFAGDYSGNIYKHFWIFFIGCVLFLPSFVRSASGLPETIGPIWTVGVEEFFYLIWPLFLKRTKKYLHFFIAIVVIVLIVRNAYFLSGDLFGWSQASGSNFKAIGSIIMEYRISCMAIGGIGAYLIVFDKKKILSFLYRKDFQWAIYILTVSLLLLRFGPKPPSGSGFLRMYHEIYSVLIVIIIVNLATNPRSVIRLDYKWMAYLGKVSYGLYLYHPIMRILSLEFTEHIFNREIDGWQMNLLLYTLTLTSTILASIMSFEVFEKFFLKLKTRFM